MMNISIRISDFAPERLVCLAKVLRQRYSARQEIAILMFSTYTGAKNYTLPFGRDSIIRCVKWPQQNHAFYSFKADKREEFIEIMPIGQSRSFTTRINLPVTSIPPCTLEIAGRCLLALDDVTYPWDARKAELSGTVTLEGVIARNGRIKRLRTVGLEAPSSGTQKLLVHAALQNLKTWRFEVARQQDPIRITYDYRIDPSVNPLSQQEVRFDLPHKVEIRGKPSK